MDAIQESTGHKRSFLDGGANTFLAVLIMFVVIVGGFNIAYIMMESGVVRANERRRASILDRLEQTVEKNAELTGRYDELVRKHDELVRSNSELIRRHSDFLVRYESVLGKLRGLCEKSNVERPERP